MTDQLSVLVLTEDTGEHAHATISAITRKVLLLLEPSLDEKRVHFDRADERARDGMGFNCYKSTNPRDHDKKVRLAQAIATHLLSTDRLTAVFVHVDDDGPWSARDPVYLCDNAERFVTEVQRRVEAILAKHGQSALLERLALLAPFWCIESWLFQNTPEALRICKEQRHDDAVAHFERWKQDPRELDEHERPKRTVSFGAKYNQRLASENFPAGRLQKLGLSFAESVTRADRPALRRVLAAVSRTTPAGGPGGP